MIEEKTKIHLFVSASIHRKAKAILALQNQTMSQWLENALRAFVEQEQAEAAALLEEPPRV